MGGNSLTSLTPFSLPFQRGGGGRGGLCTDYCCRHRASFLARRWTEVLSPTPCSPPEMRMAHEPFSKAQALSYQLPQLQSGTGFALSRPTGSPRGNNAHASARAVKLGGGHCGSGRLLPQGFQLAYGVGLGGTPEKAWLLPVVPQPHRVWVPVLVSPPCVPSSPRRGVSQLPSGQDRGSAASSRRPARLAAEGEHPSFVVWGAAGLTTLGNSRGRCHVPPWAVGPPTHRALHSCSGCSPTELAWKVRFGAQHGVHWYCRREVNTGDLTPAGRLTGWSSASAWGHVQGDPNILR